MSRTIFLDIDDVLMAHIVNRPSNKLGFSDWRKLDMRKKERPHGWGGWYSQEMLDLIVDVFSNEGDNIVWLTTWELMAVGANDSFSAEINWKRMDEFPLDWLNEAFQGVTGMASGWGGLYLPRSNRWWKHDLVERAHQEKHPHADADHVIWVDNELTHDKSLNAQDMLDEYRLGRIGKSYTLVAPSIAWSRESIESFRL